MYHSQLPISWAQFLCIKSISKLLSPLNHRITEKLQAHAHKLSRKFSRRFNFANLINYPSFI